MKTIILILISILSITSAYSQEINLDDIVTNLKNDNIKKAKEISDKSIVDSKFSQISKTWFLRALTYHAIYESPKKEIKTLPPDPLFEAYNSYQKTMILDSKKEFNTDIIKALRIMTSQFVYEGIQFFNSAKYENALKAFENGIKINKMPEINQIDTIILFNAAISAEKLGNLQLAVDYYSQLIVLQFGGSKMFLDLAVIYKKMGKETEYINTLKNGIKLYPNENIDLITELINHYLEKGNSEEAMIWVEKGISQAPKNSALHFVKGSLFDQKGDFNGAEKEYVSALSIDPEYSDALFNIGVLYYNKATDLIKKATNKDEQNNAFTLYGKAQPHLEKIELQSPEDIQVLKMLKTIYTLLKLDLKLQEVNKKLEKLKE